MQQAQIRDNESGSGSGNSDLSNLENDTDTLGRAILRHERDARRFHKILGDARGDLGNNMSRSFTSKRLRLLDEQEREDAVSKPVREVEPGLNVPKAWGRRRKVEQDWSRQSRIPVSPQLQGKLANGVDRDTIVPHRTVYSGDEYLNEDNAIDVEDTPPSMKRRRQMIQPTSLRHMNSRMREIVQTEGNVQEVGRASARPVVRQEGVSTTRAQDVKAKLEEFRQRRYPKQTVPKPPSPTYSDKENVPEPSLKATNLLPRNVEPLSIHQRSVSMTNHNKSDSMQMLERLAKVTQSPPRTQKELNADASQPEPPTPMVTGGWIETPKPGKAQSQEEHGIKDETQGSAASMPYEQPKSDNPAPKRVALAEITPVLQSKDIDLDSETVRSDQAHTTHRSAGPANAHSLESQAEPSTAAIPKKKATSVPSLITSGVSQIAALNKHISDVLTTHQQTTKPSRGPSSRAIISSANTKLSRLDENGKTVCEHCGGPYTSIWRGLWIEFRSNFWLKDRSAPFGIRLTQLGSMVLTFIAWYLLESLLCYRYCQPLYATSKVGSGVMINAPEFPFVIPTLLFRPFKPIWRHPKRYLDHIWYVFLNWLLGTNGVGPPVWRAFSFEGGAVMYAYETFTQPAQWATTTAAGLASASSRRAVESAIEAIDELGQMW